MDARKRMLMNEEYSRTIDELDNEINKVGEKIDEKKRTQWNIRIVF